MVEKLKSIMKWDLYYIKHFKKYEKYNGNIGLINKNTAKVLLSWLEKYDIPYDEIYYGKPWQGKDFVDDKTIRPNEFKKLTYDEILEIVEFNKMKPKKLVLIPSAKLIPIDTG